MKEFIDETSERLGTDVNRESMMAVQGFQSADVTITENEDYSITIVETNADGHTLTTNITEDEDKNVTVVSVFQGEKTITKTTNINADSTLVSEVLS